VPPPCLPGRWRPGPSGVGHLSLQKATPRRAS
jgi:hypothetical protein